MTYFLEGSGVFIWVIRDCERGNIPAIIDKAKENNISWLAPKITDGTRIYWNNEDHLAEFTLAAHAAGIKVLGWGWTYGKTVYKPFTSISVQEAEIAAWAVNEYDLDAWIIDAEAHYKREHLSMGTEARYYMKTIQRNTDVPVFLCSYRYPEYHREFPWGEFLHQLDPANSDGHMPQVYWERDYRSDAGEIQVKRSYAQLQARKELPFIPVGSAYNRGDWHSTVAQMDSFVKGCKDLKSPAWAWWSWQHIKEQAKWDAIKRHYDASYEPPPPPPFPPEPPDPEPNPTFFELNDTDKEILVAKGLLKQGLLDAEFRIK